ASPLNPGISRMLAMQTIARSMADRGPIHATCTPDCRPIRKAPAQPNATPPASDGARPNHHARLPHWLGLITLVLATNRMLKNRLELAPRRLGQPGSGCGQLSDGPHPRGALP